MKQAPLPRHFTTRRGFITATGFGVVSLYGLWAAYGAAPLPLLGTQAHSAPPDGQAPRGHAEPGGHGGDGQAASISVEEFKRLTEEFIAAHKLPDDSVQPLRGHANAPTGGEHSAAHHPATPAASTDAAVPLDAYLMAFQFGYSPAVLRLERDTPYRFRMMAVDVTHGAALRIGNGSHIVRLRPGVLVEQELRFTRPGRYLVYCTTYCGLVHDRMRGQIIVA
jgi:cytochrome c oxidase subunit II